MKPLDGDPELLLRAEGRCAALALEVDGLQRAVDQATGDASAEWSGPAAAVFEGVASGHRRLLDEVRALVTRMGVSTRAFARELADAQARAKQLPEVSSERTMLEERITLLRDGFRRSLVQVESDVTRLLLRAPIDGFRWTGPVRPPVGWRRDPPQPPRWTGPVRPPVGIRRNWPWFMDPPRSPVRAPRGRPGMPTVIEPLAVPTDSGRHTQLAWTAPWFGGSGDQRAPTRIQPIVVTA